jgi:hypothetical protein
MVNNSTNIIKTNNHHSAQITEHKKTTTYDIGNSGPGLGQTQTCGRVKSQRMTLEIQVLAWDRHKHVSRLNRVLVIWFFHYCKYNWSTQKPLKFKLFLNYQQKVIKESH